MDTWLLLIRVRRTLCHFMTAACQTSLSFTMEYYSASKTEGNSTLSYNRDEPGGHRAHGISQLTKDKYCVIQVI